MLTSGGLLSRAQRPWIHRVDTEDPRDATTQLYTSNNQTKPPVVPVDQSVR